MKMPLKSNFDTRTIEGTSERSESDYPLLDGRFFILSFSIYGS